MVKELYAVIHEQSDKKTPQLISELKSLTPGCIGIDVLSFMEQMRFKTEIQSVKQYEMVRFAQYCLNQNFSVLLVLSEPPKEALGNSARSCGASSVV